MPPASSPVHGRGSPVGGLATTRNDQVGANTRAAADLGAATGGQQEASGARKGFFGVAASW
jgi:hypothetical protein